MEAQSDSKGVDDSGSHARGPGEQPDQPDVATSERASPNAATHATHGAALRSYLLTVPPRDARGR